MTRRLLLVGTSMGPSEVERLPAREAVLLADMVLRMHPELDPRPPAQAPPPSEAAMLARAKSMGAIEEGGC